MPAYHKFVFDFENRKFLGRFEEMYQAEDVEGFDSWNQEDLRFPRKRISYAILSNQNFPRILDLGCGKGFFTQLLKQESNYVLGVDSSPTAIQKAKEHFPDIDFLCMDVREIRSLKQSFDLVLATATLGYIAEWPQVLKAVSEMTKWIFIAEYIPPDPIGFVKSVDHLVAEVRQNFEIETKVVLNDLYCLLMAKNRNGNQRR